MPMPKTDQQRQARSRQARAEAGGKQVNVWLEPKAARKLETLQAAGETIAAAINRLLLAAKPKGKA